MQWSGGDWRNKGTQEDNPFAQQGNQGGEVVSEVDSGRSFTDSEGERLRPQVQAGYARQATGSDAENYAKKDGSDQEPDSQRRPLEEGVRPGEFEPGGLPTTWPRRTASCPLVWPTRPSDKEMVLKHWPDKDSWPMLKDKERCVRGFVANFEAALCWKAMNSSKHL